MKQRTNEKSISIIWHVTNFNAIIWIPDHLGSGVLGLFLVAMNATHSCLTSSPFYTKFAKNVGIILKLYILTRCFSIQHNFARPPVPPESHLDS
jgi:hypothetical protein